MSSATAFCIFGVFLSELISHDNREVHVFRITNFFHINQTKLTIQACNDSTKFQCNSYTKTCIKTLQSIITKSVYFTFCVISLVKLCFTGNTTSKIRTCIHHQISIICYIETCSSHYWQFQIHCINAIAIFLCTFTS